MSALFPSAAGDGEGGVGSVFSNCYTTDESELCQNAVDDITRLNNYRSANEHTSVASGGSSVGGQVQKTGSSEVQVEEGSSGKDAAGVAMTTRHTYAIVHFETGPNVTYSTVSELNIDSASETLML